MTENQAKELIKVLHDYYKAFKSPFSDKDNHSLLETYCDSLVLCKYSECKLAIKEIIKTSIYFPMIPRILEFYQKEIRKNSGNRKFQEKFKTDCHICEGNGFVLIHREEGDIHAYCTQCSAGKDWIIDTRNANDHPSPYHNKPVTYYHDLTNLIKSKKDGKSQVINFSKLMEQIKNMKEDKSLVNQIGAKNK